MISFLLGYPTGCWLKVYLARYLAWFLSEMVTSKSSLLLLDLFPLVHLPKVVDSLLVYHTNHFYREHLHACICLHVHAGTCI